ncbi:MAG: hypothetical protein LC105_02215, partial [Chitinophagales bacterium]|nr:hypothetical protein [Chitinophagales bacterium]
MVLPHAGGRVSRRQPIYLQSLMIFHHKALSFLEGKYILCSLLLAHNHECSKYIGEFYIGTGKHKTLFISKKSVFLR